MPEIWFPNLGIEIEHLDRVAFSVLGFNVYWYGVLIGIGVLLGIVLLLKEAKRTGQNTDQYFDFAFYALIFSVIGARLYYVIFSWEHYSQNLAAIFDIRSGGLAIYGGVIGGLLTAVVYSRLKKMNTLQLADTAAPSLILGQAIGRWGNFLNREAFGEFTGGLFAMRYQLSQVRMSDISENTLANLQTINGVDYIQVHPTFLYESLWNFATFIILIIFSRRKKFHGEIAALYFLCYGLGRVWIEGLRTDQLLIGGIPVSQVLSAALVIGAVIFLVWSFKRKKNNKAEKDSLK